jgi:hypothetical protein
MKATVAVTQTVEIEVSDALFTEEFMKDFRKYFYDFMTPAEHLEHLAQLFARDVIHNESFIEGYGKAKEKGIRGRVMDTETQVLP